MRASPCTTCSIGKADLSAYWHPDLYYQWPNGTYSLVPTGGLTIYYLHRSGTGDQANPAWRAFPPGFRMVSGDPTRRSYNSSSVADQAISFACLSDPGTPETPGFPTATHFCKNGLRLQVHFPQCWDGQNLDSPTHRTHVAFPTRPDGGNCPSTHPVRLTNMFFEAFYSVGDFPHGTGTQPFVLSTGDPTGYSFHGDFLSGWDQNILQSAIRDPTCDINNTSFGNNVKACNTLSQYVQDTPDGACPLNNVVNLNEWIGLGVSGSKLPGCNPITSGPAPATACAGAPTAGYQPPATTRFHLKAVSNSKYVTAKPLGTQMLTADSTKTTYWETFTAVPYGGGYSAILNEATSQFLSADGTNGGLTASRGTASDWELYTIVAQPSNHYAIISKRNNQYLTVQQDNTVAPTSTTVGNLQLFDMLQPTGGSL